MKTLFIISFLFLSCSFSLFSQKAEINKSDYYKAISSENLELIDDQINIIRNTGNNENSAFLGALLMKKAGLVTFPATKLSLFKEGRLLLEASINKNNKNAEYRFLRLIIQEHAPGFLGYNKDMEDDCKLIISNVSTLSDEVKLAIKNYIEKSKVLKMNG